MLQKCILNSSNYNAYCTRANPKKKPQALYTMLQCPHSRSVEEISEVVVGWVTAFFLYSQYKTFPCARVKIEEYGMSFCSFENEHETHFR